MAGGVQPSKGAGEQSSVPLHFERADPPLYACTLRPNRSLSQRGARLVMVFTAAGLGVSLVPFLGTPVGWALLPFLIAALVALNMAIRRSYRDGTLREEVRVWPDLITVQRVEPRGGVQRWHANPYWVTATLHEGARVEKYLTLAGGGREIELGAFLSPEQRMELHDELIPWLRRFGG